MSAMSSWGRIATQQFASASSLKHCTSSCHSFARQGRTLANPHSITAPISRVICNFSPLHTGKGKERETHCLPMFTRDCMHSMFTSSLLAPGLHLANTRSQHREPMRRHLYTSGGYKTYGGGGNGNGNQDNFKRVVLYSLVGLNTLVFLAWKFAKYDWQTNKNPTTLIYMMKNFLSGEDSLKEGRPWTLLTSCISHEGDYHFLINMVSLVFTAPAILTVVGPATFLGLYFGAGIVSSTISLAWEKYMVPWIDRGPRDAYGKKVTRHATSHGASGALT
jgi:membrane associated rhomboid family serine protease